MFENLVPRRLVEQLKKVLGQLKDHRKGQNTQYELQDAGLGAFSVFFTQSASFLAHQLAMKLSKGRSNAESLFEMGIIPSDNQIRSLLDPVEPGSLSSLFGWVFAELRSDSSSVGSRRDYRTYALVFSADFSSH